MSTSKPQESVIFREAQLADLPDCALVIDRANAQRDNQSLPTSTTPNGIAKLEDKLSRSGAWADVAVIEERIAGIALGYPTISTKNLAEDYPDAEYLSLLMVEPVHWGKRIASTLLDRAAERTYRRGKRQLLLLTRESDNGHAQRVYEHKGYVKTGETRASQYGRQVLYLLNR